MVLSCSEKDNPVPDSTDEFDAEDYDLGYEANPRAFALKFTDYIGDGAENIQRLDNDTVRIAINDGLLTYLNIRELLAGDVLNIWENIDRPPYIRVVDAVEKTASGYIVTTHEGSMGDLFHSIEGCFDTELYSRISERPVRSGVRSASKEEDYKYVDDPEDFEQFVEESGKIHPFIYYTAKGTKSGEYEYFLAEKEYDEMMDSLILVKGPSWMKSWNIINSETKHINIYPKKDKDGLPVGLYVNDASLALKANMELYFQFNLFSSNRFWAKMDGEMDLDIPLHIRFAGVQLKGEQDIPVMEFMPKFFAFSIGPFVVPVVIRHGFIFKYSASVDGNLAFMVPIHYHSTFQTGPKYDNGHWSGLNKYDHDYGINYDKLTILPSASVTLKASTGFYYHIGAYLGAAIGPFFELGLQANMVGNASASAKEVKFNSVGKAGLGGSIGAEIKIWKFDLGKVSIPYYAKAIELWNFDLSFETEDLVRRWQSMGQ